MPAQNLPSLLEQSPARQQDLIADVKKMIHQGAADGKKMQDWCDYDDESSTYTDMRQPVGLQHMIRFFSPSGMQEWWNRNRSHGNPLNPDRNRDPLKPDRAIPSHCLPLSRGVWTPRFMLRGVA